MKKNQLEKVNMFNVVALFFTANATLFQGFIKLVAEITNFITIKKDIDTDIQNQQINNTGITSGKNTTIQTAISLVIDASRKARI